MGSNPLGRPKFVNFSDKTQSENGGVDFPKKELNQPPSNAQIAIAIRIQ